MPKGLLKQILERGLTGNSFQHGLSKSPSSAPVSAGDKVEGGEPRAGAAVKHFHPFLLGKAHAGFPEPVCVGMGMI